jgi:hypothetical protein
MMNIQGSKDYRYNIKHQNNWQKNKFETTSPRENQNHNPLNEFEDIEQNQEGY